MTTKRMRIMIVLSWFHSIFWAVSPWAFNWGEYVYDPHSSTCRPKYNAQGLANELYLGFMVTFCFAIPVVSMIYFYTRIFSIVEKHVKNIEQISNSVASLNSFGSVDIESSPKLPQKNLLTITDQPQPPPSPQHRRPKELRAHNMILIIILIFIFCWATYSTVAMARMVLKDNWGAYWAVNASLTLALLNSALNPLVYASRDRRFKRGFKKIFWPIFCKFEKLRAMSSSNG